ncbi:MAG: phenylalanine--tRNA ligase subunit beta, partial [Gemmatimonadetes bacterium]
AWAGEVWALELALPAEGAVAPEAEYRPLPAFPPVERDLALLVPDGVAAADLDRVIAEAAGPLLERAWVFDRYAGDAVPAGHTSLAYRLRLQAHDRTLTDRDADRVVGRVLDALKEALGVEQRV